jgi:hypothetical protein
MQSTRHRNDIRKVNKHRSHVCEHKGVTVLWNPGLHTNRECTANRPDITVYNNREKTCILIYVAIPADRNVMQNEAENKIK